MMLIPFHSKASGEFFMFDHHVKTLFELMGKPYSQQGAIDGIQAGVLAHALEQALKAQEVQAALQAQARPEQEDDEMKEQTRAIVSLKQRAWPLLDMLRRAAAKNVDVVWGSVV